VSTANDELPFHVTLRVRDTCLCLHLQQAARAVARRFDTVLRPLGLTNGQFSLLMSLNRPEAASIGGISTLLAMDRMTLTPPGRALLVAALPVWEHEHAAIEGLLTDVDPDRLRADLRALY